MNDQFDFDRPRMIYAEEPAFRFVAASMLINAALVIVGLFVAGLMTDNRVAWLLALMTAAVAYLTALVQVQAPQARPLAIFLTALTILIAIAAAWSLVAL